MKICGVGMKIVDMESICHLRVTQSFKRSLKPLILPYRLIRVSERALKCYLTLATGKMNHGVNTQEGVKSYDPMISLHYLNREIFPVSTYC